MAEIAEIKKRGDLKNAEQEKRKRRPLAWHVRPGKWVALATGLKEVQHGHNFNGLALSPNSACSASPRLRKWELELWRCRALTQFASLDIRSLALRQADSSSDRFKTRSGAEIAEIKKRGDKNTQSRKSESGVQ